MFHSFLFFAASSSQQIGKSLQESCAINARYKMYANAHTRSTVKIWQTTTRRARKIAYPCAGELALPPWIKLFYFALELLERWGDFHLTNLSDRISITE